MKVLFLDFDGVINSQQSNDMFNRLRRNGKLPEYFRPFSEEEFCPVATTNLVRILDEVQDLKIVISSSWRIGEELSTLQDILENIGVPRDRIIDKTPYRPNKQRGAEIREWLDNFEDEEVEQFAVVDDSTDMDNVLNHFFKTDWNIGLTYNTANDIIKFLKMGKR